VKLPPATLTSDTMPRAAQTPETYLSVGKEVNYGGTGKYDQNVATFVYPPTQPDDSFALSGSWILDYQGATANSDNSSIRLNYHAENVYIVAGGTGTLTVRQNGKTTTFPITGPPNLHEIVAAQQSGPGTLEVRADRGLEVFSFTYG